MTTSLFSFLIYLHFWGLIPQLEPEVSVSSSVGYQAGGWGSEPQREPGIADLERARSQQPQESWAAKRWQRFLAELKEELTIIATSDK